MTFDEQGGGRMVFRSRTKGSATTRAFEPVHVAPTPVVSGNEPDSLLPAAPLSEEVFAACGSLFTWGDVHHWMLAEGTWAAAERCAAEGRALALGALAGPSGDALRQAAQRFRRERKLIAGEDLTRWLAHWGIAEEEWVDWLDRSLRRAAHPDAAHPGSEASPQETWVEAVCSGALSEAAKRMGRAYGAWAERSGGEPPPPADRFSSVRRAYDDLVAQAPDRAELERIVATNALPWLQLAFESVSFGTADAAREALAACRDDGETLASVAALAGADVEAAVERAEDLAPRLRSAVVSAPLGVPVLAGTPEDPGLVVLVRGRRHPTIDDPADEELAAGRLAAQRVESAMDRWVAWRA